MSETGTLIGYNGRTIGREELTLVPTPPATETHRPILASVTSESSTTSTRCHRMA